MSIDITGHALAPELAIYEKIVSVTTVKSQRAIEKLGAVKEGIFRNNYVDSEGKSKDDVYYSVILEEWKKTKNEYFGEFL